MYMYSRDLITGVRKINHNLETALVSVISPVQKPVTYIIYLFIVSQLINSK